MHRHHPRSRTAISGIRQLVQAALLLAVTVRTGAGQPHVTPTQNALAGSRVFGSKGCINCHAIRGIGGTDGPDLATTPRTRTVYDLGAAMWNHLPTMVQRMQQRAVAPPRLNDREAADLIAFLYSQDFFDTPGNPTQGKQVFADKQCVICHQVGGVGGVVGPELGATGTITTPIQVASAMWNHGPNMSEAMASRGIQRPRFTQRELSDLIAYVDAEAPAVSPDQVYVIPGPPLEGSRVFAEKGCGECHAVGGVGGRVAPDLAARSKNLSMVGFAAAMWNKAPAMTAAMRSRGIAVPQLSPAEMANLIGYLYSVRYFARPGNVAEGRRLLGAKGCVRCHTLAGAGGKTAPDLAATPDVTTPAAVIAALWNHEALIRDSEGAPGPWPTLSPTDIAHLTEFLADAARKH